MPFDGYPLEAAWTNESPMWDLHAEQHNAVESAVNNLQDQVTALAGLVAGQTSLIADLQDFVNLFNAPWTAYTPTLYNVTIGTGTRSGEYVKIGRLCFFRAGFVLGSGFTMSNAAPLGIGLPPGVTAVTAANGYPCIAAWANNSNYRWGGTGIVAISEPTRVARFADENSPLGWKQNEPFAWGSGDGMSMSGVLQTTT
jgi:hypothetical protein